MREILLVLFDGYRVIKKIDYAGNMITMLIIGVTIGIILSGFGR